MLLPISLSFFFFFQSHSPSPCFQLFSLVSSEQSAPSSPYCVFYYSCITLDSRFISSPLLSLFYSPSSPHLAIHHHPCHNLDPLLHRRWMRSSHVSKPSLPDVYRKRSPPRIRVAIHAALRVGQIICCPFISAEVLQLLYVLETVHTQET